MKKIMLVSLIAVTMASAYADVECIAKISELKCVTNGGGSIPNYSAYSTCHQSISYKTSSGRISVKSFQTKGSASITDAEKGALGMTVMLGWPILTAKIRNRAEGRAISQLDAETNYLQVYPNCSESNY